MKGWMYILKCADGSYYTGSTNNLKLRFQQHQSGEGANYTRKRLPVELVYYEEYARIDIAFNREKQVQGWSRRKKDALISSNHQRLHELSACRNESHFQNFSDCGTGDFGSAQPPGEGVAQPPGEDVANVGFGSVQPSLGSAE